MRKVHDIVPSMSRLKKAVLRLRLHFWAQGFIICASQDLDLQKEISKWPDGFAFLLQILPDKPYIGLIKDVNDLHIIPNTFPSSHETVVAFKNMAIARDVFCGKIGIHQAFCENRFDFKSNQGHDVSVVRAMILTQHILFPQLEDYGSFKNKQKKRVSRLAILSQILLSGNRGAFQSERTIRLAPKAEKGGSFK